MKKGIIALLACVLALSMALVGCAGGGFGADAKAAWVGTWDLHEMDDNGQVTSAEDIELLRSMGLDVYLDLNEDGTASLVLFGEAMDGTWEAKGATEAALTTHGQAVDMAIADDKLSLTQDGSTLTFVKGEPRSASAASASASASSASSSAN